MLWFSHKHINRVFLEQDYARLSVCSSVTRRLVFCMKIIQIFLHVSLKFSLFGPFLDESTLIYWNSSGGKPSQNECWWIRMKHEFISLQYISRDSFYWHELDSMPVWVSKHMLGKMWDKITYPCMFGHAWISLGMDKQFHRTLYCVCDYLSMLGLRLSDVIKRDSRLLKTGWIHICTKPINASKHNFFSEDG